MSLLAERCPGMGHVALGVAPTPVRPLDLGFGAGDGPEVWLKDESVFGDGAWGGNKVRKLEWIIPEAQRRGTSTLFTVGGIGTHWGLACALYGREHGLATVLGLVDQPVDDHVREQLARLEASGAELHRYPSTRRLKLAAPWILARHRPWYLPAGGSNAVGTLGYVDVALEIAAQVASGDLPEPATMVVPVGSGGTVAGLTLGFRIAGLRTHVLGAVVNDMLRLDNTSMSRLARRTASLLRERGLPGAPDLGPTTSTSGPTGWARPTATPRRRRSPRSPAPARPVSSWSRQHRQGPRRAPLARPHTARPGALAQHARSALRSGVVTITQTRSTYRR